MTWIIGWDGLGLVRDVFGSYFGPWKPPGGSIFSEKYIVWTFLSPSFSLNPPPLVFGPFCIFICIYAYTCICIYIHVHAYMHLSASNNSVGMPVNVCTKCFGEPSATLPRASAPPSPKRSRFRGPSATLPPSFRGSVFAA